jgi:hypothetical protein
MALKRFKWSQVLANIIRGSLACPNWIESARAESTLRLWVAE